VVEGSIWVDPGPERRWTWSSMAAGDMVMFHSLAVHQGRDNTSGDRIRLAASFATSRSRQHPDGGPRRPPVLIPREQLLTANRTTPAAFRHSSGGTRLCGMERRPEGIGLLWHCFV
jgi:hypothetical protein